MSFTLNILILGEYDFTRSYLSSSFDESGETEDYNYKFYKEIKIFEDTCILEIILIPKIEDNFATYIESADGLLYFLNPLHKEDLDLFDRIYKSTFSRRKRSIPLIISFYHPEGLFYNTINDLLERIWIDYPSLEAFINTTPQNFHQILHCLCLAMINREEPLNIDNAWMRFPILIQMANLAFKSGNFYLAALSVKKAAMIASIYNLQEYHIFSEMAAYLFSKLNLYLEASKMMEDIDKTKCYNFKKKYTDQMLIEGNKCFNKGEYKNAAKQYEYAAQWASNELNALEEQELISKSFSYAIHSWIHACNFENAFQTLKILPYNEELNILREISEVIYAATDYLIENGNYELAKEQLYLAIAKYQNYEQFNEILIALKAKAIDNLTQIFNLCIKGKKRDDGLEIFEEIENLWKFKTKKEASLDTYLEKIILLFLEEYDLKQSTIITSLFNKIESQLLKEKIDEKIMIIEEQERKKRSLETDLSKSLLELDQDLAKLQSKVPDFRRERDEFCQKRKKLKNRYYLDIFDQLKARNFVKSGNLYSELANDFLNRQDYKTGSLLILLYGLSLLKAGISYDLVNEKVKEFLKDISKDEEIIKGTFYGLLLLCLISSKLLKRDDYFLKIKKLMEILPLLEEEKELIKI